MTHLFTVEAIRRELNAVKASRGEDFVRDEVSYSITIPGHFKVKEQDDAKLLEISLVRIGIIAREEAVLKEPELTSKRILSSLHSKKKEIYKERFDFMTKEQYAGLTAIFRLSDGQNVILPMNLFDKKKAGIIYRRAVGAAL